MQITLIKGLVPKKTYSLAHHFVWQPHFMYYDILITHTYNSVECLQLSLGNRIAHSSVVLKFWAT